MAVRADGGKVDDLLLWDRVGEGEELAVEESSSTPFSCCLSRCAVLL